MDRNRNNNESVNKGYTPKPQQKEERGYTPRPGQINNGYQPSTNTKNGNSNIPDPAENEEV